MRTPPLLSGFWAVGSTIGRLLGRTAAATPTARRLGADRLHGTEMAWPVGAIGNNLGSRSSTNAFFPDPAANYWMTPIWVDEDTEIVVEGEWPAVRYFSFQTYTMRDRLSTTIGGIRDAEMVRTDSGGYRLSVVPHTAEPSDDLRNTIAALPSGRTKGVTWLTFRTYVSTDPARPAGGVDLPTITVERLGEQTRLEFANGAEPVGGDGVPDMRETSGSVPNRIRGRTLRWSKPGGTKTPIPNIDAAYLAAFVAHRPGEIGVVKGLAPTFPNDETAADDADVRYWSLCMFGLPSTRTISCGSDFEVPLDAEGRYTFVISDQRDRPANATALNNVCWLPWGPEALGAVGLRNIAPSDQFFPKSIQAIGPGDRPRDVMDEYFPEIRQCTRSIFEDGGADACFGSGTGR